MSAPTPRPTDPIDPTDPTGPRPPKEPFSYVSQERGLLTLKIREPLLMGLFFLALTVVGVIFFFMVKKGADQGAEGAMGVAYLILAIFGGLGVIGMGIAAVRWRWKREYVRVMGRSPWAEERSAAVRLARRPGPALRTRRELRRRPPVGCRDVNSAATRRPDAPQSPSVSVPSRTVDPTADTRRTLPGGPPMEQPLRTEGRALRHPLVVTARHLGSE